MLVPLNILKQLLPQLELTAQQLADQLSQIGLESEVIRDDTLEVEVTPNRGDCLSLYGIARELVGFTQHKIDLVEPELTRLEQPSDFIDLIVDCEKGLVVRDELLRIENYQPTTSPQWLIALGKQLGWQPRDLLIDLTNYVMWELGCPLHVFSANSISSGLHIQQTSKSEEIALLDGSVRQLPPKTLVQYSGLKLVDLVGIMGAKNSSFSNKDKTAIVQAGVFSASTIRAASKALGLKTDASHRYERSVDPYICQKALARLAFLAKKSCPNLKVTGFQVRGELPSRRKLPWDSEKIAKLLGVSQRQIESLSLKKASFLLEDDQITIPTWRNDIGTTADIAEEVARVIGYDQLATKMLELKDHSTKESHRQIVALKNDLAQLACTETYSYAFAGQTGVLPLSNPRTKEQSTLRANLQEGLLTALARNPFLKHAAFFEIGHVFAPAEHNHLAIVTASAPGEDKITKTLANYGLKASFESVEPKLLDKHGVRQKKIKYLEVDITDIGESESSPSLPKMAAMKQISKYPCVSRDITLATSLEISSEAIEETFNSNEAVVVCELIDRFENDQVLGQGKVAMTFRLLIQDKNTSLTDEQASQHITSILEQLRDKIEFELR